MLYIHKNNKLYIKVGESLDEKNPNNVLVQYRALYEDSFPFLTKWSRSKKEFEDRNRFRKAKFLEVLLYIIGGKEVKF